ncbi:TniQ family protein [Burkholderia sp. Bp8963]|uniref:TniQ family protein n=1 Tax=Burkholderia sp. Bp8963 TaxID=2184547 RepID=UPI003907F073
MGGGRVEQLSSFAIRCAEQISVCFIDFYREKIAPLFFEGRALPQRVTVRKGAIIDGTLGAAEEWANALNRFTGRRDLQTCTLLPWRDVLAPRRLARDSRAWCSVCLEEMRVKGEPVYEPLVWRFREVDVCPDHRARLATVCPACGRGRQHTFSATARVGCCRYCGSWMGRAEVSDVALQVTEHETFYARTCEQMLELSSTFDESQFLSSDLAVQALRDVFFGGRGSTMAKAIGHGPRQVNKYQEGAAPAPLNVFLRAAWVTGATPEQIFVTGRFDCQGAPRETVFDGYRARSERTLGRGELRRGLDAALAEPSGASVRSVALRLGIDPTVIWRSEPALAARLSRAYAVHVAEESQRKKASFEQSVLKVAEEFRACGRRPTLDEMREALGGSACFINPWRRHVVIRTLYAVFGGGAI